MKSIAEILKQEETNSEYFQPLILYVTYSQEKTLQYYRKKASELNKEKKLGGDILVLDSTKETAKEMSVKAIKFIFNKKGIKRDLKREQEMLNDIERQYNELSKK